MPLDDVRRDSVALFKRCLRTIFASIKSAHADEAVSAYYGFRTHAALLAALPDETTIIQVSPDMTALMKRLETLGYRQSPADMERVRRLFQAELIGRIGEKFQRMASETANDNATQ